MVELVDWNDLEPQDPGTPGWYTLAIKVKGETRKPADRIIVAIEHDRAEGECHVLLAADIPEFGPEVITPFEKTIHVTIDGVHTFVLSGASKRETIRVRTPNRDAAE